VLRINLFGSASIEASGVPVTGRAAQGRRLALLALLACARGRSLTRDRLIGLLWPDSSTERARRMLSDDVYIVRNALGDDALRSIGDELSLDPDTVTSDVALFERLLDEDDLQAAIALVTGPLLDGFHLSDATEFERWLDAERSRLGQRYAAALQSLAERYEARQQFAEAVVWWRKLATHDPYSGRVTLGLMRALEAAGDRAGALRHARVHTALLRAEYDTRPDPEVIALAERLRVEPAARATEPGSSSAPPSPAETTREAASQHDGAPEADGASAAESGVASPDVAAAPQGVAPAPPIVAAPTRPSRRRHRVYQAAASALLVAAVAAGALVVNAQRQSSQPLAAVAGGAPSVGVLPFVNMSADPENTYFSDGLTEQIISALSRIDGLQVAARTSSFALRDGRLDVRAIGDTLGVTAVLEGSVRTDGSRLRITAQLIDAATGYHIWSEDYDRQIEDVFAVQEEIAAAIATALELRLARRDIRGAPPVVDLETYDLYLRGLYMRNSLTADALRQAVDYFDRAIARQPDFALAYAAKASVIAPLMLFGHAPFAEGGRDYRALTAHALELDPASSEAHTALGIQKLFFDWEWDAAGAALERAIELNPNDAHAYHHYANYLHVMGRLAEAVAARERSLELDPLNPRTLILLAGDYNGARDHERAIAAYERARTLDPAHPLTLGSGPWLPNTVAWVYLDQGKQREAVADLIRIATLRGATPGELDALRRGLDAAGMTGFWRSWLEMDLRQDDGTADPLRIAKLLVLSGDTARGLDTLDRAFAERNPGLIMLNKERAFRDMRTHPRISRIARAMGLPAAD
jgi:TolB-like protein/DNA-binding SARP family transcriptional activator/Flp pilus assembly protein TadD